LKRQENAAHAHPLPAFRLAVLIGRQQVIRLRALMKKTPDYPLFKYALLGAILDCPDIPVFIPPNARKALDRNGSLADILRDTRQRYASYAMKVGEEAFNESSPRIPANLRWLLESRGIDIKYWSTSKTYVYPYLFDPTNGEWASLVMSMAAADPEFRSLRLDTLSVNEFVGTKGYYFGGRSEIAGLIIKDACQALGAQSRDKLASWGN